MRAACIDIGSNTTRLLIADRAGSRLSVIHEERVFTRLGQGLRPAGAISAEKVAEVAGVVADQLAVARARGADAPRIIATAAVRCAANGPELVAAIAAATGHEVEILTERDEARLAFRGACGMMDEVVAGEVGVVDVGGGSSEVVVGRPPEGITWWASVALGSGALADHHLHSDPPTPAELAAAREEVERALTGHRPPFPAVALAVGGSATSLGRVAGPVLDAPALRRALAVLAAHPAVAVAERFAIPVERARLLPGGLLILEAVAGLLATSLTVGRGGVREGVLLDGSVG